MSTDSQTDRIDFFHSPFTRSATTLWLLEELEASYDLHLHDVMGGRTADYLAINPTGKVPAIRHQGRVLSESCAISLYLCPEKGLAPALTAPERMDYLYWTVFRASALEPSMSIKAANVEVPYGVTGWNLFEENIAMLAKHMEGRAFITGDDFTGADVLVASFVNMAMFFKLLDGDDHPILTDYTQRMIARPAYQRARKMDQEIKAAAAT